jgi:cyclase
MEELTPRVRVIFAGFNGAVTVFQSQDGPVIIDSADAASAAAVQAMIRTIDSRPPVALILTHYHGDHVGGALTLASGAPIWGHEKCLAEFKSNSELTKLARPYQADTQLPLRGETIRLLHPGPAHTSGDTAVVLEAERIIVAGDLFFNGVPPYIDVNNGADTEAWAHFIEAISKRYAGFRVVAGHGGISDTEGWLRFAGYLRALRQGVAEAVRAGQTREQAQASVNLDAFDWIQDMGDFLTKKANIGWVYDELTRGK